jgi:hypothetical protein
MDQSAIYRKEVAYLMERLLVKPDGAIIMNTPEHKMGLGRDEVIVFTPDGKEIKKWEDLSDEVLYAIFCFLDTAQKLSPEVVENFVQLGSAEEKTWHIEPIDIVDGSGKVPLGKLGVAIESKSDAGEQLAVVFISPDGTWATLTMYDKCLNDEVQVAKDDLKDIGLQLMKFADKL